MTFEKLILPACPNCNEPAFRVIEIRHTKLSTRRRKQCDVCKHRATTHEVTEDTFKTLKENQSLIVKLSKLLFDKTIEPPEEIETLVNKCDDCQFNNGNDCTFNFPEYNTVDSYDCNHYQPSK